MQWFSTVLQSMTRLFKWWVVVASWEQGVRVRFGKKTTRLDPGVHFRIPFLDRIYIQSTRTQVVHTYGQSISTPEGKVITFGIAVRFQIQDIVQLYNTVSDVGTVLLFDAISQASHLISTETDMNPSLLEDKINDSLAKQDYGLCEVHASVVGFCQIKSWRFIVDGAWIPMGKSLDDSRDSGEVQ